MATTTTTSTSTILRIISPTCLDDWFLSHYRHMNIVLGTAGLGHVSRRERKDVGNDALKGYSPLAGHLG